MAEQRIKKDPVRQCLGCSSHKPKREMMRVVRLSDGSVELDLRGKVSGRGAYVCRDINCFKRARKSARIDRVLECNIPDEIYDCMERMIAEEGLS